MQLAPNLCFFLFQFSFQLIWAPCFHLFISDTQHLAQCSTHSKANHEFINTAKLILSRRASFTHFPFLSGTLEISGKQISPARGPSPQRAHAGRGAHGGGAHGHRGPGRTQRPRSGPHPPAAAGEAHKEEGGAEAAPPARARIRRIPAPSSRALWRSLPRQLIHWLGRPDCLAPAAWRHPFTRPASPLGWRRPGGRPDNGDAGQHNDFQLERPGHLARWLARAGLSSAGVGFFLSLLFFHPPDSWGFPLPGNALALVF
jgi:hypothetical protein